MFEVDIGYLVDRNLFLQALEAAGVDNWDNYSYAKQIYNEWKNTQDEE